MTRLWTREQLNGMYWKSIDGRETYIPDMEDKHLKNTICYLERKFGKDGLTDWKIYKNLTSEAKRRNLDAGNDWDL